jgi:cytochrome c oxidase subunit IV
MMPMSEHAILSQSEIVEEHQTEAHTPYVKVWAALLVLTVIEYFYASIFKDYFLLLVLGLMGLALVKAGLVGWFFMHLKFEGNWVYIMIVPACILATIIVFALCPDMVLKYVTEENPGEDDSARVVPGGESHIPRIVRTERPDWSLSGLNSATRTFDST